MVTVIARRLVNRLKTRCNSSPNVRVPSLGELLYENGSGNNRVLGVSDFWYLREMTKQRLLLMCGSVVVDLNRVEMLDVIEMEGGGEGGRVSVGALSSNDSHTTVVCVSLALRRGVCN